MIKAMFICVVCMLTLAAYPAADTLCLSFPDAKTRIEVWYDGNLKYNVSHADSRLLASSEIDMLALDKETQKRIGRVISVSRRTIDERIAVSDSREAQRGRRQMQ